MPIRDGETYGELARRLIAEHNARAQQHHELTDTEIEVVARNRQQATVTDDQVLANASAMQNAYQPGWEPTAWPEPPAHPAWVTILTAIAAAVCIAIVVLCAARAGVFWSAGR